MVDGRVLKETLRFYCKHCDLYFFAESDEYRNILKGDRIIQEGHCPYCGRSVQLNFYTSEGGKF